MTKLLAHDDIEEKEEKDGVGLLLERNDTGNAREEELLLLRHCQSPSISVETLQRLLLQFPPSECCSSMHSMSVRRDTAACLLRHSDGATNAINNDTTLDSCLDAWCGPWASIQESLLVLRDVSRSSQQQQQQQPHSQQYHHLAWMQRALRSLRRYIVASPHSHNDPQRPRRHDEEGEQDDTEGAPQQQQQQQQAYLLLFEALAQEEEADDVEGMASVLLSVPVLVANACATLRVSIPSWSIRSNFLSRLVEQIVTVLLSSTTRVSHHSCHALWETLLPRLIRHGSAPDVAKGLYRVYDTNHPYYDPSPSSIMMHPQEIIQRNDSTVSSKCSSSSSRMTPRDMAMLLQSMLLHVTTIATLQQTTSTSLLSPAWTSIGIRHDSGTPTSSNHSNTTSPSTAPQEEVVWPRRVVDQACQTTVLPCCQFIQYMMMHDSRQEQEYTSILIQRVLFQPQKYHGGRRHERILSRSLAHVLLSSLRNNNPHVQHDNNGGTDPFVWWETVARQWSEPLFVRRTDTRIQQRVTEFLLTLLGRDAHNNNEANHIPIMDMILILVPGVTARLESSLQPIRQDGMRIAEAMGPHISQPQQSQPNTNHVRFDDLDGYRDQDEERLYQDPTFMTTFQNTTVHADSSDYAAAAAAAAVAVRNDQPQNHVTAAIKRSSPTTQTKRRHKAKIREIDPDAEYNSDDDDESDQEDSACSPTFVGEESNEKTGDDWDDNDSIWEEDDFVPYDDLDEDDEADLRDTPRPVYLRQCLAMWRTGENEPLAQSRQEAALQEINLLVRSQPADLVDLAPTLAHELLHLENKYDIPNFASLQQDGLVALLVHQPISVSQRFIVMSPSSSSLFESGVALGTRLQILHTLNFAAEELCGQTLLNQHRQKRITQQEQMSSIGQEKRVKVSGKRRLVKDDGSLHQKHVNRTLSTMSEAAVVKGDDKTRRWGRRSETEVMVQNRFGPVAPVWVYALLGSCVQSRTEIPEVWYGANGIRLMTHVLLTLSTMVECCGNHPGNTTCVLACDVWDLAVSFSESEAAELRSAALVTMATCITALPERLLFSKLDESLFQYLRLTALEDSDGTCRKLAKVVSTHISNSLRPTTMMMLESSTK